MPRFPGANEPCRKHAFAITSYELRLTLGYLTTSSVAREAMAASSSSVMSMARLNCVVSVLLNVGALPQPPDATAEIEAPTPFPRAGHCASSASKGGGERRSRI